MKGIIGITHDRDGQPIVPETIVRGYKHTSLESTRTFLTSLKDVKDKSPILMFHNGDAALLDLVLSVRKEVDGIPVVTIIDRTTLSPVQDDFALSIVDSWRS